MDASNALHADGNPTVITAHAKEKRNTSINHPTSRLQLVGVYRRDLMFPVSIVSTRNLEDTSC